MSGAPCIANGDGTCFENGESKPTTNMFCTEGYKWSTAQDHLEDMEYFVYKCRKFGRCK